MKTRKEGFVFVASISNNKLFAKKRISELDRYDYQIVATKNYCYNVYAPLKDREEIAKILDR